MEAFYRLYESGTTLVPPGLPTLRCSEGQGTLRVMLPVWDFPTQAFGLNGAPGTSRFYRALRCEHDRLADLSSFLVHMICPASDRQGHPTLHKYGPSSFTGLCSSLVIRFDGVLNQLLLTAHETQERFLDSAFAFRRPCDYEFNGPGRLDQGTVREIAEPVMLQA